MFPLTRQAPGGRWQSLPTKSWGTKRDLNVPTSQLGQEPGKADRLLAKTRGAPEAQVLLSSVDMLPHGLGLNQKLYQEQLVGLVWAPGPRKGPKSVRA